MCYTKSISFGEFLMECCTYDEGFVTTPIKHLKLLHYKVSEFGQVLHLVFSGLVTNRDVDEGEYVSIV